MDMLFVKQMEHVMERGILLHRIGCRVHDVGATAVDVFDEHRRRNTGFGKNIAGLPVELSAADSLGSGGRRYFIVESCIAVGCADAVGVGIFMAANIECRHGLACCLCATRKDSLTI